MMIPAEVAGEDTCINVVYCKGFVQGKGVQRGAKGCKRVVELAAETRSRADLYNGTMLPAGGPVSMEPRCGNSGLNAFKL